MITKLLVLFTLLLTMTTVFGDTPIGSRAWDLGDGLRQTQLGGEVQNYADTDSTFAVISNSLISDGDTAWYRNTADLKSRISNNGRVLTEVTIDGVNYRVWQRPVKLVWLNVQTKNWVDIIPNLSWSAPAVSDSIVRWGFPGFDYSVIHGNNLVDYEIKFKKPFLDSAVFLYDQRADSQYIALANVHAYSFVNIDNSTLTDIAEVNMKTLKKIGNKSFNFSPQILQWTGSDTARGIKVEVQIDESSYDSIYIQEQIPITQRWVKVGSQIYCVEFVMMSDVKRIHEQYPNAEIWHNTETVLEQGSGLEDSYLDQYAAPSGDANYGATTGIVWYNGGSKRGMIKLDLSSISSSDTVDSVSFQGKVAWSADARNRVLNRMLTDWTEGIQVGAAVTDGFPGVTWDCAEDVYPSGVDGGDTRWGGGGSYSSSDYDATRLDSASVSSNSVFEIKSLEVNSGDLLVDVVQGMVDGTYSVHAFSFNGATNTDGSFRATEYATAADRPTFTIWHVAGGAAPDPQVIIIGNNYIDYKMFYSSIRKIED